MTLLMGPFPFFYPHSLCYAGLRLTYNLVVSNYTLNISLYPLIIKDRKPTAEWLSGTSD